MNAQVERPDHLIWTDGLSWNDVLAQRGRVWNTEKKRRGRKISTILWLIASFQCARSRVAVGERLMMGSLPTQEVTGVGRAPRRMFLLAGLITPTLVASCTPEDAGAIAWGRGTITFANDCDAGPTKARFRLPLETPVMRVNLRGRAGTDVVTEFISIKKGGDTVQLLNKYRTDVSPSISSYCKGLPFLELLMRIGLETIVSGGSAEGMKKGSLDLLVEAYTGSDLRALGTVTVEWEM